MATDTTPVSDPGESEGRDYVPRWLLLLIVAIVVLGGLWVLVTSSTCPAPPDCQLHDLRTLTEPFGITRSRAG